MTLPKPPQSRLRGRTGCRTCRTRRVKCDEQRPACQRCTSTGRTCDGYALPSTTEIEVARKHQRTLAPSCPRVTKQAQALLPPTMASGLRLGRADSASFQFFMQTTAPAIAGSFGSLVWDKVVFQLMHHEPSVLHAVIAVGSIHMNSRKRQGGSLSLGFGTEDKMALRHYLVSLDRLRYRISVCADASCAEIALIVCVLFVCLEILQGNGRGAIMHLETGLRILLEGSSRTKPIMVKKNAGGFPRETLQELTSLFTRLDLDSMAFAERSLDGSAIAPLLTLTPHGEAPRGELDIPEVFASLGDASRCIDGLTNLWGHLSAEVLATASENLGAAIGDFAVWRCYQYAEARAKEVPEAMKLRVESLRSALSRWSSAFKSMPREDHHVDDDRARSLLHLRHFCLRFSVLASWNRFEKEWDAYGRSFHEAVMHAECFLGLKDSPPKKNGALSGFTLQSGCIPALYLVALKCRVPETRWQAISLLRSETQQEGMWTGKLIALFVEQLAKLEESGRIADPASPLPDIPESSRYSDVVLAGCEKPGYGRVVCARYRHEADKVLLIEQVEFPLA